MGRALRVLLVRLSSLGDIVHTWPLAAALRQARPDLHLTWVVEEPFRDLVDGHPAVDEVLTVSIHRWRRAPLSRATWSQVRAASVRLRALAPDLAIDAQGLVKSALVTWWTGARRRVGLCRPWRRELAAGLAYTDAIPGSRTSPHVVATNLELVRAVGATPPSRIPSPDGGWLLLRNPASGLALSWDLPCAGLLVGAGRPTKTLPTSTLVAVAHGLRRMGFTAVAVWGPGERAAAEAVVKESGGVVHLAPPTSLGQLVALLGQASLVVGADTGPLHLAASLGVPTLGVFLTTSDLRNGPLGERVATISAVAEDDQRRSGSARARTVRTLGADEILDTARRLLG
jgi:heptosyltransferase I